MRLQPYGHEGRTSRRTVTTLNLHKPIIMLLTYSVEQSP